MQIKLSNTAHNVLSQLESLPIPYREAIRILGLHNVHVIQTDDVVERSAFGTPVFMSLTFEEFQWTETIGAKKVTHKTPKFHVPCVVCEVSFQKTIVRTFVQRQRVSGSFKQHITFGDYAVSIKGILCNDNDKYPIDLLNFLNQICRAPVSIEVTNTILTKMGIYNLIIDSGTLVADSGGRQNMQPFTLSCYSDDSRSLTINKTAS